MSLKDIFQRNRAKQLDTEPEEGGDSELMAGNDAGSSCSTSAGVAPSRWCWAPGTSWATMPS